MSEKQQARIRILLICILDCLAITAIGGFALLLRFDFSFSTGVKPYAEVWMKYLPLQLAVTLIIFFWRRMYHYVWRVVSAPDVMEMFASVVLAFAVSTAAGLALGLRLPISVMIMSLVCQIVVLVGMRCALRLFDEFSSSMAAKSKGGERIMLIGAGQAGRVLLQELSTSKRIKGRVCCVIDDNPSKHGKYLEGVRICGGREDILRIAEEEHISQIILAIPSATAKDRKDILERCKLTGCRIRVVPGIFQLVNGEVSMSNVKDVQVEDLLGREPVQLDKDVLYDFLGDRVVLVTGGGGSIGSELCRQIAQFHPRKLVILDIYENNAYDLQQELRPLCGAMELVVEIATVREREKLEHIFAKHRPDIVFHAAAHKHVPLMEACPEEAIKNNIFGTYNTARTAEKYGVKKFVMISTDKAVNPTNVMGATKRFCEMILQSRSGKVTQFCAVRFGNVLGSNGSVVPLFKRQIEKGGPVTITDKRIIRYFMTIPEAAQLVLEAGAMARHNEIFVLDMGEPVKILTLAENLIRLSGLRPYEDIEIREIGLRPGEKLYEELLIDCGNLVKTSNKKIFVEQQKPLDEQVFLQNLHRLEEQIDAGVTGEALAELMRELVPTYRIPEEVNAERREFLTV